MEQIITKQENRYKVFQAVPMYNAHPYFSLKNFGNSACYTQQKYGISKSGYCICLLWAEGTSWVKTASAA